MKNRAIAFGVILVSLLVFFSWAVFFRDKKAPLNSNEENFEVATDLGDGIDQEQPEIAIYSPDGLIEYDGVIYVGDVPAEVNWEEQILIRSEEAIDVGYVRDNLFYGMRGTDLVQIDGEEIIVLAQGVSDIHYLKDNILFLNSEGVQLLSPIRNTVQRLLENTEEMPVTSLEGIFLVNGTQYYVVSDDEDNTFEIYINETKELLSIEEGCFLSASPTEAVVLYGDSSTPTRLGVYFIETSTDTQMHLTAEGEEVTTSPHFDERGRVRYLTKKDGVLYSNAIDIETRLRDCVELANAAAFVEDLWVDGYYVISFAGRFYYGTDPQFLSYYDLSFDQIRFKDEDIFLSDGSTLRVIRDNQYKEYSLKGVPVEMLPAGEYLYYTYYVEAQPFVSRVKIQF
ncbi:MAG: hypothetical protein GX260_08045 [Tissierellia bacterium]|nr:hypothetical protein [Bacillota bacterium]NLL23701.1 hypothetical protein [Tissierellia bacterium]